MKTVLEELWYGNIDPHETILRKDRHYRRLLSLMDSNRDKLTDSLTDKQKEMLNRYDEAINEMHSVTEQAAFQYGFSLGVHLILECDPDALTEDT